MDNACLESRHSEGVAACKCIEREFDPASFGSHRKGQRYFAGKLCTALAHL